MEAAKAIAWSPKLKAELQEVAYDLAAWMRPMGPELLLTKLVELAPAYHIPPRSPGEWVAFFKAYMETLSPLPREAFDEAIVRWNRGEFFPKDKDKAAAAFYPRPVQIWELAQPTCLRFNMIAYRADKALKYVDALPPPRRDRMTRAEMIEAGFLNADGSANLGKPKEIQPTAPTEVRASATEVAERLRAAADMNAEADDGELL